MIVARAPNPLDQATRYRLDGSRALVADREQIWARERTELHDLARSNASHPGKLAIRRAPVMAKYWSREIYDELIRPCGFVRLGGR